MNRNASLPRLLVVASLLMMTFSALPYLLAAMSAPAGTTFSGVIIDRQDFNSHLAKMQQGARGSWLYQLLFTAEPHEAVFLNTFYVALGHVVRISGLSQVVVYHLARLACILFMIGALWRFMTHFLGGAANRQRAGWALVLCLFGGGWSIALLVLAPAMTAQVSPIEFWLLDGYTFLAAFVFPHFAFAIGVLASGSLALERWTGQGARGSLFTVFVTSLTIAIIQPYDLPLVDGVIVAVTGWRILRKRLPFARGLAGLALVGLSHAAVAFYYWYVLYGLPVWTSFRDQNFTPSPPPVYYLLGYAPLLIPALAGAGLALRRREGRWLVPTVWMLAVAGLVYLPIATQRRFVLGVQTPLAALAVYWLAEVGVPWLRKRYRRRARLITLAYGASAVLSTVALIAWTLLGVGKPDNRDLYIPEDTRAAWAWIEKQTAPESVILAAYVNGGNLVGHTGRRTVLGQWSETVDYPAKSALVRRFFTAEADDAWRLDTLRAQHVAYVWYSAEERALGGWTPAGAPFLRPVFESAGVTLYQVLPVEGGGR